MSRYTARPKQPTLASVTYEQAIKMREGYIQDSIQLGQSLPYALEIIEVENFSDNIQKLYNPLTIIDCGIQNKHCSEHIIQSSKDFLSKNSLMKYNLETALENIRNASNYKADVNQLNQFSCNTTCRPNFNMYSMPLSVLSY